MYFADRSAYVKLKDAVEFATHQIRQSMIAFSDIFQFQYHNSFMVFSIRARKSKGIKIFCHLLRRIALNYKKRKKFVAIFPSPSLK